jgi:protein-disulfide isomerase
VTFVNYNIDKNATSMAIGHTYGVTSTPTTVVLRKDGAAAIFVGVFDPSTVKSAIEDARK